jgi:hypothetical protein
MYEQQAHQIEVKADDPRDPWQVEWDEWVAEGFADLERYLAKHAAFAEFLRRRGEV